MTLHIDDLLAIQAIRLSGISEKTAVVRAELEALTPGCAPDGWRPGVTANQACRQSTDADRSRATREFMPFDRLR